MSRIWKGHNKINKKNSLSERKSEEINDLIERMPMRFGNWVSIFVLFFSLLFFLFGWIIKYPDTVSGEIKINSSNTIAKLVANASGNVHILLDKPQCVVKEGDYIAVIQNSANVCDVKKISILVNRFDPNSTSCLKNRDIFPKKVSLGDLNLKYYTFMSALNNLSDFELNNIYNEQINKYIEDTKYKKIILSESQEMLQLTKEKLQISQKWFEKYKSMNKNEITTYDLEVDKSKTEFLSLKLETQNLRKEITSFEMQIVENTNYLNQLKVEQSDKRRALRLDLLASYHDLSDNIKLWEQKYVLKAPFSGKLEYLKFINEEQFIQNGEELFCIVPKEKNVFGQVSLPSLGAGKVKRGDRVVVKLKNYPYMEFGTIEGYVKSISLVSRNSEDGKNSSDNYLIIVSLPNGLKTNYGERLEFKFEINGTADIVVNERRLIERIFDNLKSGVI